MADNDLRLIATCALGLEEFVAAELAALGLDGIEKERGAVTFRGGWQDVYRANYRLRTANRVLVELASWPAESDEALARGAEKLPQDRVLAWGGVAANQLFHPSRSFALRATSRDSRLRDNRWVTLKVKDGLVDGQRRRWGRRASVDRNDPDLHLRILLVEDRATLLLDTSGDSLGHRGYRVRRTQAPVRETLAAACVLAAQWDGKGPVVDPMCGSGTLLAEAASLALGRPPGILRREWAFERLPGYNSAAWAKVKEEKAPVLAADPPLFGVDRSGEAIAAARLNLAEAGLLELADLRRGDAFEFEPPAGPGIVLVNPAYGERLEAEEDQWRRLGDLLKQRYSGYRAVVLTGDPSRGKHIGLKPERRIPVRNGPLDARILIFDLY